MKKIIFHSLFLITILAPNASAYVNMANQSARASDLKMTTSDYAFAMAISGALTGFAFGMFLWKAR